MGSAISDRPFLVIVDPPGWRCEADEAEEAIHAGRELLEEARSRGWHSPMASFYGNGVLVRAYVTRTELATDLGRCWCGRGNLYGRPEPGEAFCCAAHEVVWHKMGKNQRARVIVARFIAIYGRSR